MDEKARAAIRSWIQQQHDNLPRTSYYVLLDVQPSATEPQIRDAYYRLVARLHPDLYGDALDASTRAQLVSIYSRLVEAYQVLSDGRKRAQYDAGLVKGRLRWTPEDARTPRPAPEASIANPHSRRLYQLAQAARKAGDLKSAVMNLKLALSAEPGSELLRGELAGVEALLKGKSG